MTAASRSFCFPLFAAGVLGLTGVALGALGAHALETLLRERAMTQNWETAARYHIVHAVASLGIAAWVRFSPSGAGARLMFWAARCWFVGTLLFSGSIYILAVGGPRWLGPVTPLGGLALLLGWLLVGVAAFSSRAPTPAAQP